MEGTHKRPFNERDGVGEENEEEPLCEMFKP